MLKRTIALALFAVTLASFHAAPALAQGGIGAKGGVNFANISFDPDDPDILDKSTRTGFIGGVYGMLLISGPLYIQAEGLYSQQGFSGDIDGVSAKFKANYIQVPLLAKFLIPTNGNVLPGLYAGGVGSFEVSCSLSGELQGTTVNQSCDDPGDEVVRSSTDFGLLFGGELNFLAGGALITIEVRYNLGLKDIDPAEIASAKQRVLSVLAGIGFFSPGG